MLKVYCYYYFWLKVLKTEFCFIMPCYWYPASRLAGYQLPKSPAWYNINHMFLVSRLCSHLIIIKNICRHTKRTNVIDIRQVTWRKSIISTFIRNTVFHTFIHKICIKSVDISEYLNFVHFVTNYTQGFILNILPKLRITKIFWSNGIPSRKFYPNL